MPADKYDLFTYLAKLCAIFIYIYVVLGCFNALPSSLLSKAFCKEKIINKNANKSSSENAYSLNVYKFKIFSFYSTNFFCCFPTIHNWRIGSRMHIFICFDQNAVVATRRVSGVSNNFYP